MNGPRVLPLLLALALAIPPSARAQSFEGELTRRSLTVRGATLADLIADVDWPDEMEEADWLRAVAARLFAMPFEAFADAPGRDVDLARTTLYAMDGATRSEQAGGDGYFLYDPGTDAMTVVVASRRAYARVPMAELRTAEADTEPQPWQVEQAPLTVRDLGRTATIAGMSATAREAVGEGRIVVGWCSEAMDEVARQLAGLIDAMGLTDEAGAPGENPADVLCPGSLPLRLQHFTLVGSGGEEYEVDEVVSLVRGPVDAARFTVPAGFTATSMEELLRMEEKP